MRFNKIITVALIATILASCRTPVRGEEIDEYKRIVIKEENYITIKIRKKPKIRYTKTQLNVREKPNTDSKVLETLNFNKKVKVKKYNKEWMILIKDGKEYGYVSKKYLRKEPIDNETYYIPEYSGYKSFMEYSKITDTSSPQWTLQEEYAYTGDYGIRMVNGRFCVAIGFAFNPKIGQYFDLVLENGTVIPCIISDEKKHEDTIDDMYTAANGCYTEFVVNTDCLHSKAQTMGDISYCDENWMSPVKKIIIYNKNVMKE